MNRPGTLDGNRAERRNPPPEGQDTRARVSRAPARYTCGGCDSTWTALAAAHCSRCHNTFSGSHLFDYHQRGDGCLDLTQLQYRGKPFRTERDVWRYPSSDETDWWGSDDDE